MKIYIGREQNIPAVDLKWNDPVLRSAWSPCATAWTLPPASSHWPKDMAYGPCRSHHQHSGHCDTVTSVLGEPGLMEGPENYKSSFKKQLH